MNVPLRFERISVATDLSERSLQTLPLALGVADRFGSRVEIVHALREDPLDLLPWRDFLPKGVRFDLREKVSARLNEIVRETREKLGREMHPVLLAGKASAALREHLRTAAVDLLVISTHGHGGLEKWVLGSVTEKLARSAPCPLLIGRGRLPEEIRAPRRVLVPYDFREGGRVFLEVVASWCRTLGAKVRLLHVIESEFFVYHYPNARERFLQNLRELHAHSLVELARLRDAVFHGLDVEIHVAESHPVTGIEEDAAAWAADLLVLATHSARDPAQFSLGDLAEKLMRKSPCPVLIVRGSTREPSPASR